MDEITGRSGPQGTAPEEDAGQGFPTGIEGTRGPKDAAEQARRHFMGQRGIEPVDAPRSGDQVAPEGGEPDAEEGFPAREGSFGETLDEAERALAVERLQPSDRQAADGPAIPDGVELQAITIAISGARTASQAGAQETFLRTVDALALVLDIVASQDLVNSGLRFDANFQVLDYQTNTVRRSVWTRNSPFAWGTHFWISQGNNWGPVSDYSTPEKWGLPVGVYALRGTIEVLGAGAFAYSAERPFRVR
jgi:hypothetical protein